MESVEAILPLPPYVYELGNSLIASLAIPLGIILVRFFMIEMKENGVRGAYGRMRVKLGLAILALVAGEGFYRSWTWWGRYCANLVTDCSWMVSKAWPVVPIGSIILEAGAMLCLIRILTPGVWGRRAWIASAIGSIGWMGFWFSAMPVAGGRAIAGMAVAAVVGFGFLWAARSNREP